jgi:hypothetical protein
MERADGPYGKGVVNDLFIPGLLPGPGMMGDTNKSVADGRVVQMPRRDQSPGGVGRPVELLRKAGTCRMRSTLRDRRDQQIDDLFGGGRPTRDVLPRGSDGLGGSGFPLFDHMTRTT